MSILGGLPPERGSAYPPPREQTDASENITFPGLAVGKITKNSEILPGIETRSFA